MQKNERICQKHLFLSLFFFNFVGEINLLEECPCSKINLCAVLWRDNRRAQCAGGDKYYSTLYGVIIEHLGKQKKAAEKEDIKRE